MNTFTAITYANNRESAETLGAALEQLEPAPTGVGVFEMEDGSGTWEVGGYFVGKPDGVALDLLAAANGARPFVVSELPDVDWVAHVRRELTPVSAGRFFVYGSHDADKVPENVTALKIEAAMAFGTGHHGTTQGCLLALDKLLAEGFSASHVADIGCGTAVLAMAAKRELPEATVLASDIDQVAVDVAIANLQANGMAGDVSCVTAAGFESADIEAAAPFDLIFANILKGPLLELAPDVKKNLANGGRVILSGLLNEQKNEIVHKYGENSLNLLHCFEIGEWSTLILGEN